MTSTCNVSNAKALIIANSVLSTAACASSLFAIAVVVLLKAYRRFLYRLTLYLAITSFFYVLVLGISVLPVSVNGSTISTKSGWTVTCALIGGLHQYFYLSNTLAIFWICLYTTKVGLTRKQTETYHPIEGEHKLGLCAVLSSCKCELFGCIVLALLPATVFWYPYIDGAYGMAGVWCWMDTKNDKATLGRLLAYRIVSRLPSVMATLVCLSLLLCVQFRLCYMGTQWAYWRPVKTVALILAYTILFALPSIGSMLHTLLPSWTTDCNVLNNMEMFFLSLFYLSSMSLPILLLLQWDIRLTISRRYNDIRLTIFRRYKDLQSDKATLLPSSSEVSMN